MSSVPPSPEHRARWRRARHFKTRMLLLERLAAILVMLAVIGFIALCYRAMSIYAARNGYRQDADVARVGLALFLAGGLVGGVVVYVVMAGKRKG